MYGYCVRVRTRFRVGMALFIVLIAFLSLLEVYSAPRAYADGVDFGLSISQPTQIGCTATYTISYLPYGNFMRTITETALGTPIATFSMGTFFLSESTIDTLSVSGLSPGTTYNVTVVANADGPSHSVSTFLVAPAKSDSDSCSNGTVGSGNGPSPDFNMAVTQTVTPQYAGGVTSVSYLLTYSSINGFTGFIHESVTNIPTKIVSFLSSQRSPSSGYYWLSSGYCRTRYSCSDILTIYTGGLRSGPYSLIITATTANGTPYHSMTINLILP